VNQRDNFAKEDYVDAWMAAAEGAEDGSRAKVDARLH
jgi:hypothetical protein